MSNRNKELLRMTEPPLFVVRNAILNKASNADDANFVHFNDGNVEEHDSRAIESRKIVRVISPPSFVVRNAIHTNAINSRDANVVHFNDGNAEEVDSQAIEARHSLRVIPPPSFVVRNANRNNDINASEANVVHVLDRNVEEDGFESIDDVASSNIYDPQTFIPIPVVQLVKANDGAYMLDFNCTIDSTTNIIAKRENKETYIDRKAWEHLLAYSELVGKPIAKGQDVINSALETNASSFVLLDDDAEEVSHTLLDIGRLFAWRVVMDATNLGKLHWKDFRSYLSIVRKGVPFATHDGLLRHAANTITFHQFVVFARMIEAHIKSFVPKSEVPEPDVALMSDIFPPFDSISQAEKEIELLASIRDREVQYNAKASGIAIPTSTLDLEECNDEWRRYVQWWSTSSDARYGFCMRELVFAEKDMEVQSAMESGISDIVMMSKDSLLAEKNLRRFGRWYYGGGKDMISDDAIGETLDPEPDAAAREPTYKCDAQTRSSLARSSAQIMSNPANTSLIEGLDTNVTMSCSFSTTQPVPTVCIAYDTTCAKEASNDESNLPPIQSNGSKNGSTKHSPAMDIISIVGSKIIPAERPVSMRCRLLRRATLQFDTLRLLFNKKKGPRMRGIQLLRSKVRLVVMIRRFLGISPYQLPAVAPENLDIFSRLDYTKPLSTNPSGCRVSKALLERAIAHRNQMLRRKLLENWMSWKRQAMAEQQRHAHAIQKAIMAHQRTLALRCLRALRAHSTQQNIDRANAVSASTSNLRNEFAIDDEPPFLVSELDGMELVVGRNRRSGLDVFPEDMQQLAGYQDLRRVSARPPPGHSRFRLLDKATLQRMKREKLAGASNLFDVPLEVIHSSSYSEMHNVEYMNRETVNRIVDRV